MSLIRPVRYADGDILDIDGAAVRLTVSARARRVSLRLDRRARQVLAVAPNPKRLSEAAAFARERADWIAARIAELPAAVALEPGAAPVLFGRARRLTHEGGRAVLEEAGSTVCRDERDFGRAALRLVKREALVVLTERTAVHCAGLGAPTPPVSVMDARTRWGSCTPAWNGAPAAIRYNWRLAFAPFAVADYVAAHEVAHLREANHGPRFWRLVHDLIGDPAPHRRWLREEGPRLHAVVA